MAHAKKTYQKLGAIGINGALPNGTPIPSSGISVIGSLTHGSEITIISDGTINFGSNSPSPLCYTDLKNAQAAGQDYVPIEGTNMFSGFICQSPVTYKVGNTHNIPIKAIAGMPAGGKAFAIGDRRNVLQCPVGGTAGGRSDFSISANKPQFGTLEAISSLKSKEYFITQISFWPAAEQENQMKNSVQNAQVKPIWHAAETLGFNGGDAYGFGPNSIANTWVGLPSGSGGGTIDMCPYVINSSTSVTITISSNTISLYLKDTPSSDSNRVVYLSNLSSVGVAGSATVTAVSGNTITLTVVGWPLSGEGTLSILKLGDMQQFNRAIRGNQAAIIPDANTDYHLDKVGTIIDPYTLDPTHQVSDIIIQQTWMRLGTPNNSCWTRVINTTTGEIYNYDESHPRVATIMMEYFNVMHFIGNAQAMNVEALPGNPNPSTGASPYNGDIIQQYGTNGSSACRVELVDTPNDGVGTKLLSHFPNKYWNQFVIKCTFFEGMFEGKTIPGNYIQIKGSSNTKIAGKQL